MDMNFFPIQSSILSPAALLKDVSMRYGLKAKQCRLWSAGLNDVYLLQDNSWDGLNVSFFNEQLNRYTFWYNTWKRSFN